LHQPPWSFGFDCQTSRTRKKQAHPVLNYRVPHGSQPRPGWAPDPPMVGIRSPIGLVVGSCTSYPGVLGSIPKREEPGKTGRKLCSSTGFLTGLTPMVGIRSPIGLVVGSCTSHPGVLGSIPKREIPKREEPGKTGAPCIKVPGSSRVPVRDGQTSPHRPWLVVSRSTCPPLSSPPHANCFVIGHAVIKQTHTIYQLGTLRW